MVGEAGERAPVPRTVSFAGDKDPLEGYLARPEGEGPFPGVVVSHELFGLNDNIRDATDLFAGRNRAACMARSLGVLAEQPHVDETRLGATGFCKGGGFAVAWACTDERLRATAPYYGTNPRPLRAVARSCTVVGSYPERDFTARSGRRLDAALERHGVPHDTKVYPGAEHSFSNDRGRAHDPAASEDSWRRTLAFSGEHLARREEIPL